MTMATGTTTRVIGWYHSHPHITVLPSHVDVRTQAMYQLLDSGFIGLIFSCFSEDAQRVGRIQVIAFQSLDGKQNHTMKPVSLLPVQKSSVIDIESSISSSDNTTPVFGSSRGESMEQDTGDSAATSIASKGAGKLPRLGGFFANADAKTGNNYNANSLNNVIHDLDPMDMSEGDLFCGSGAEFVRKEIPLHVLPTSSLLNLDSPLSSFTNLQRVLLSPAMNALQDRLRENEIQLKLLAEEANLLESELLRGSPSNSSPRSPSQSLRSGGHRDLYPADFSHQMKNASGSRIRRGA
ncbi:UNVERIFIED_CONTAM: Lys-63-specific deubiquitinase BRCC36 [Sesamum angustifolium]|uniref:Lys-63-specific deubiquitinase BRCC36 n=1 Tax=Sesamum angustifolium TaxID=2727405 RepID=A0AAW2RK90_9LAMI